MALIFSPLSEDVLGASPQKLLPKRAFIMRQLGAPPDIDVRMSGIACEVFTEAGFLPVDADGSTGKKDYLERILGLIRATGFSVAIFSDQTRQTAFANISLELGFAAMCGKPLMIIKSRDAEAPSDLKRTDWIEFDPAEEPRFREKLQQAIAAITELEAYERNVLGIAFEAHNIDCAVAFERIRKLFLLTGDAAFIAEANRVLEKVREADSDERIGDLQRLTTEIKMFVRQAGEVLPA